ncbi:short-chain dehydrogenase, partial [Klebsiella pneumoniae]|nr:short-chain dehydrogenase [Klebsiella pneumoniae]
GFNYKILIGDKKIDNVIAIVDTLEGAGYDIVATEIGKADKDSIATFIEKEQSYGEIDLLINVASVSPNQASNETILKVDLYGIAVLLEEVA